MSKYAHLAAMMLTGGDHVNLVTDDNGDRWAATRYTVVSLGEDAFGAYGWVPDGVYRLGKNRPPDRVTDPLITIKPENLAKIFAKEQASESMPVAETEWLTNDAGVRGARVLRLLRRADDAPVWVDELLWSVWRSALGDLAVRVRSAEGAALRFERDGRIVGLLMPVLRATVDVPAVPAWLAEARKAA